MIDGPKIKIGDTEYIMPALTLGQLRNGALDKIRQHDKMVQDGDVFGALPLRGEIIGMALRRNYPDLTDEALFEVLDLRNSASAWMVALGASSLPTEGGDGAAAIPPPMTSGPSIDN